MPAVAASGDQRDDGSDREERRPPSHLLGVVGPKDAPLYRVSAPSVALVTLPMALRGSSSR